jgi:hypothetical protein
MTDILEFINFNCIHQYLNSRNILEIYNNTIREFEFEISFNFDYNDIFKFVPFFVCFGVSLFLCNFIYMIETNHITNSIIRYRRQQQHKNKDITKHLNDTTNYKVIENFKSKYISSILDVNETMKAINGADECYSNPLQVIQGHNIMLLINVNIINIERNLNLNMKDRMLKNVENMHLLCNITTTNLLSLASTIISYMNFTNQLLTNKCFVKDFEVSTISLIPTFNKGENAINITNITNEFIKAIQLKNINYKLNPDIRVIGSNIPHYYTLIDSGNKKIIDMFYDVFPNVIYQH